KGLKNWMLVSNWLSAIGVDPAVVEVAIRSTISKVEDSDVGMVKCGWIMRASAKNFLASLVNPDNGTKVFPSIDTSETLMGYPIKTTSQIPVNLGVGGDETEVYFGDFDEVFIGDAYVLTLASSTEAAYVDAGGTLRSAFQDDLTLMRAISEHDLAPRHDEALAGISGAGWTL
ncbi:MAG: phage major capsid protein, partial [Gammaproteobacteria bacterium]|nr:phage major capsid protein [Gammaproteobacteria bacterium]